MRNYIVCEYDKNAVAIVRDDQIVGHIPQVNSKVCAFYIGRGGTIKCRVILERDSTDLDWRFYVFIFSKGMKRIRML